MIIYPTTSFLKKVFLCPYRLQIPGIRCYFGAKLMAMFGRDWLCNGPELVERSFKARPTTLRPFHGQVGAHDEAFALV